MDTVKLDGVEYTARVVTLGMVTLDELMPGGVLDQQVVLKASIIRTDGEEVDWDVIPIWHALRMVPMALKACGFTAADAEGNV